MSRFLRRRSRGGLIADPQPAGQYLVVQDLRPFGYRVESSHRTLPMARLACRGSRYLKVETREFVEAENARLRDHDEFLSTLRAAQSLDGQGSGFRRFSQSVNDR